MNLTINVKDVTGYPTPSPIGATGTTIIINGIATYQVNVITQPVVNNSYATIIINKTGYYTYTNTIRVFDFAIGMDIILVPIITDVLDSNYRKPYPLFFEWQDPCSFNIYVYNASSAPFGTFSYYLDNVLLSSNNPNQIIHVTQPAIYTIKQVILTETFTRNISTDVNVIDYKPQLDFTITKVSSSIDDSVIIGEIVTVTPIFIINAESTCTSANLLYTLTDASGNIIATQTNIIDLTVALPDPSLLVFVNTLMLAGDYTITIRLSNCCTYVEKTQIISATQFLKVIQDGHKYTVINSSLTKIVSVRLYDYTGTNPLTTLNNTFPSVINPTDNLVIDTGADGSYIIKIIDSNNVLYIFVVHDYNDAMDCFISLGKKVICDDSVDECVGTDDRLLLNKLIFLTNLYFSYLQSTYGFNNIYTSLSNTDLQDIYEAKQVFSMIQKLCACGTSDTDLTGGCKSC